MTKAVYKRYIIPTPEVSDRMKKVKSKNTGIEKAMEIILKNEKIKYVKHPKLHGHPDFKITKTKILIFCDSSFWHGRHKKDRNGDNFKKNKEFWAKKISDTWKRDKKNNRILKKEGWQVLRFWDTDIKNNPNKVVRKIKKSLKNE